MPGHNLERFTRRARHVLTLAQTEAERMLHERITTEHLLLALLGEEAGVASRVLSDAGLSIDPTRRVILETTTTPTQEWGHPIELSGAVKRVLELAVEEARTLHHHYIGTEHLLLGLLRLDDARSRDLFARFEADPADIRDNTLHKIKETSTLSDDPPGTEMLNEPSILERHEKEQDVVALISPEEVSRIFDRLRNGGITLDEAVTLLQRNMQPYTIETIFRYIMRLQSGWPTENRVVHIKLTDTRDNSPGGEIRITGKLAVMAFTRLLGNLSEGRTGVTWTGMSEGQSAEIRIDLDEGE
jgi:hypothetical protein